jgi:hypothetical protein
MASRICSDCPRWVSTFDQSKAVELFEPVDETLDSLRQSVGARKRRDKTKGRVMIF